ncbi:MAG TPA: glycosyltransferase family A protein [Solirubrobacterales bacterium]|jgi:GT2 family glycosyltransferase|nr:glycosyltransferase family A protein [Solirubrobacterales bacterium]
MPAPTLAVVVPATDDPPTLDRCLEALEAGQRCPDELTVQREPGGSGPAAARNLGSAETTADVLVFVDSDVEVDAEALARIERHFQDDSDLTAVFGAYDEDPGHPGLASRYRNLLHHHVHSEAAGEAETFWAGLGAVRREAFESAGGFDEDRYPQASVEDIELGMRLRQRRFRILLDPRIRGRHLKRWTVASMVRTDFGRRGVPWARLLLREGSDSTALNLGWRRRLSAATSVTLLVSLLARRPRAAAAALLANLALDRDLYALLARRGGPRLLVAGIGLHQLHQLSATASVPVAVALHVAEGARR